MYPIFAHNLTIDYISMTSFIAGAIVTLISGADRTV